jgi:hypothetical protein
MIELSADTYRAKLETLLEALAAPQRGDDARGRNLQALYFLKYALRYGWFAYAPSRQPGRWLIVLLDLCGAASGRDVRSRLDLRVQEFMDVLRELQLSHVADMTCNTLVRALEPLPPYRTIGRPLLFRVLSSMGMVALLRHLGVDPDALQRSRDHAGSVHGQKIRQQVSEHLDVFWCEALARLADDAIPDTARVLAGLPPSFSQVEALVEHPSQADVQGLHDLPFAVFYARVTDAPDHLWESGVYVPDDARSIFEESVGRMREHRKARDDATSPPVKHLRLGLRSACPRSLAVIDRWLERQPLNAFFWEQDWTRLRLEHAVLIEVLEHSTVTHVSQRARQQYAESSRKRDA